ncbi:hypothetical protein E3J79_02350 [Candidatus Dependentiae bacterium]|nr:MAG: hypothetical protein E3J79_02350 [Candidatus Dependentiae bacterium]
MTNSSFFPEDADNQFTISYELLCLLRWLTQNEDMKLKRIISKALSSGLNKKMQKIEYNTELFNLEEAQQSIIYFFSMLENIMVEVLNEQVVKQAVEKKLIPALEHIDSTVCDDATVRFSVEKASSKSNTNAKESPQELFFKEILKRWKPRKKNVHN